MRALYWGTGLLASGHQLWLGHGVASFLTLALNAAAGALLYVAMVKVRTPHAVHPGHVGLQPGRHTGCSLGTLGCSLGTLGCSLSTLGCNLDT